MSICEMDESAVGPTEDTSVSRMVIGVAVEGHSLEQVIAQLDKLVSVISIKDVTSKGKEVHDTQPDYQN